MPRSERIITSPEQLTDAEVKDARARLGAIELGRHPVDNESPHAILEAVMVATKATIQPGDLANFASAFRARCEALLPPEKRSN